MRKYLDTRPESETAGTANRVDANVMKQSRRGCTNFSVRAGFLKSPAALLPFLLLVLLFGCEDKLKPTVVPVTGRLPDQESWNSTIVFSDSGDTRGILWAGHLLVFNNENKTYLGDSIRVDFYDNEGRHTSFLTADSGIVDNNTNNLEAIGNVYVHSDSGTSLWTQRLFWNDNTQKVTSDVFVRIVSPKESLEGVGFESDRDLTNYRVFNVSGEARTAK